MTNEPVGASNPYWIASTGNTDYPSLNEDIEVDVAIVGGGIAGISTAYLLNRAGLKVAVIEADRILQGTTGHTTAKITSQHGLIYAKLKKQIGEELTRQYAEANQHAIQQIAETIRENKIECDFDWRPAFVYTQSGDYLRQLEDEANAASSLGIKAGYLDHSPLPFPVKASLRFEQQAQFHPLKYLKSLAQLMIRAGGQIFEHTEAVDIEQAVQPVVVTRNGNKVSASKVVIASHFPFFDGGNMYFARMYVEKSYIVAAQTQGPFPQGMFISAENPTRSLRSQPFAHGEMVLFAGEHHKTGHDEDASQHYQNLIDFAAENFKLKNLLYRWSTQDCMTMDGIPYIGNLTEHNPDIYVATGFGKWGMSNGTAAAMILTDLIMKGDSPWAKVYNPSRVSLTASSLKTFITQNAMVAKDLLAGKLQNLPEHTEIGKGEAAVIEYEGKRMGIYRDEDDKLHMIDTTCTHLGCELAWNSAEKTWDCPCHGSRFSPEGDIIEGPAINKLHHAEEGDNIVEAKVFK